MEQCLVDKEKCHHNDTAYLVTFWSSAVSSLIRHLVDALDAPLAIGKHTEALEKLFIWISLISCTHIFFTGVWLANRKDEWKQLVKCLVLYFHHATESYADKHTQNYSSFSHILSNWRKFTVRFVNAQKCTHELLFKSIPQALVAFCGSLLDRYSVPRPDGTWKNIIIISNIIYNAYERWFLNQHK